MGDRQNFSDIGERISRAVQDALESRDFSELNHVVNDTVAGAMDEVRYQVNHARDAIHRAAGELKEDGQPKDFDGRDGGEDYAARYRTRQPRYPRYPRTESYHRQDKGASAVQEQHGQDSGAVSERRSFQRLVNRYMIKRGKVSGILLTVFGSIGMGLFWLLGLICLLGWLVTGGEGFGVTVVFGVLGTICGGLLFRGCSLQARLKRAERYLKLAREKMYMSLEDLAARTGQSVRKVRSDVRSMLNAGIFPEGHMDKKETTFVISDETWEQYLLAQKEWQEKKQLDNTVRETQQSAQPQKEEPLSEEQQIEKDGRAYMDKLRQLNTLIPGEIISNKLYQLDYLLQRIFMVLKEHPEKSPQMRKFMDYYLPTTVKLVESYADFDKAGVQGENIISAKAEIEKTMDTINQAFEKLLDDMYQNAAMEAAADAQVLKTVLAQDGYTKNEFTAKAGKESEE